MAISGLHVRAELVRRWQDAAERRVHPSRLSFRIGEIRGCGDLWVADGLARYDGGPWQLTLTVLELCDGKIGRETVYSCGAAGTGAS
jgi:hypothetical protein